MENFAKETKQCVSSFLSNFGNLFDDNVKERRRFYETKYQHKQKRSSVQALERWKKERKNVLMNMQSEDCIRKNQKLSSGDDFDNFERENPAQVDIKRYKPQNELEVVKGNAPQRNTELLKKHQRFSLDDIVTTNRTELMLKENMKNEYGVKHSYSFDDAESLYFQNAQQNAEDPYYFRYRFNGNKNDRFEESSQNNDVKADLHKMNDHWRTLREKIISTDDCRRLEKRGAVTAQAKTGPNHWKLLKENVSKAVACMDNVRRKSVDVLMNIKEKYGSSCCLDGGSLSHSSSGDCSSNITKDTDLSNPFSPKRPKSARPEVKYFPFCDEYDGRSVRRTKTISESIQAILEEKGKAEELSLRREVEKMVTEILTVCMSRFDDTCESTTENGLLQSMVETEIQKTNYNDGADIHKYSSLENDDGSSYEISEPEADTFSNISQTMQCYTNLNVGMELIDYRDKLKITIFSIENISDLTETEKNGRGVFIKTCQLPQKGVKQKKTQTLKGNEMIVFNEDFELNDISADNVENLAIRFRVYLKANKFYGSKNRCIGEALIWLDDVDLKQKVNLCVKVNSYL